MIWKLNQAAFEGGAEANLVDALRDGGFAKVSLVVDANGQVVGHVLFRRFLAKLNLASDDVVQDFSPGVSMRARKLASELPIPAEGDKR